MGNIQGLPSPGTSESCVVGDHVYLVLNRAELVNVVDALHLAGDQLLEQRLAEILRQIPRPPRDNLVTLRSGLTKVHDGD